MSELLVPATPFRRAQLFQEPLGTDRPRLAGVWLQPHRIFASNGRGLYVCPCKVNIEHPVLVRLPKTLPTRLRPEDNLNLLVDPDESDGLATLDRLDITVPVHVEHNLDMPDIDLLIPAKTGLVSKIGITPSILSAMVAAWPKDTIFELAFQDPTSAFLATPHAVVEPWSDFAVFMPAVIS